eukprot:3109672-Lingulodinium_polyedra.AAC.1
MPRSTARCGPRISRMATGRGWRPPGLGRSMLRARRASSGPRTSSGSATWASATTPGRSSR